ncbi:hypothetical protein HK100_005398 [Physocladia obscura]|uniref:Uncharacterized protein n=1 Tax=Physocladia obscura TaxID=109957 RepID=A0AAD5X847_9FUNG|nr:hypothetical protein HK100_005398 [Physocladia obscura]
MPIILLALPLLSLLTVAQASIYLPVNIASGAAVSASSTSSSGACLGYRCAPGTVVGRVSENSTGQWVSNPGSCSETRAETLNLDWSATFGMQYVTEIRFRFGDYAAGSTNLVVYDTQPMNIPNPTAVAYINSEQYNVYVFEIPVTATSLAFIWSNFTSPDGGVSCQVSVRDVQVWTGPSPDSAAGNPRQSHLSPGAVAGISVAVTVAFALVFVGAFIIFQRRKNIKARAGGNYELGSYHLYSDQPEIPAFDVLEKKIRSARMKNFFESTYATVADRHTGGPKAVPFSRNVVNNDAESSCGSTTVV